MPARPKGSPIVCPADHPAKSQLNECATRRFLLIFESASYLRNFRDLHFPYPEMLRTIFSEVLTMAQVAFDYYSPAFLFSKAHAEPPGFIGVVQA
jgi:hypothetical protein